MAYLERYILEAAKILDLPPEFNLTEALTGFSARFDNSRLSSTSEGDAAEMLLRKIAEKEPMALILVFERGEKIPKCTFLNLQQAVAGRTWDGQKICAPNLKEVIIGALEVLKRPFGTIFIPDAVCVFKTPGIKPNLLSVGKIYQENFTRQFPLFLDINK